MTIYEPDPGRTALLVIDAQREYFDADGALFTDHAAEILDNLQALLDSARRSGTRVVFVRDVQAADGSDTGRMADFDDTPVVRGGNARRGDRPTDGSARGRASSGQDALQRVREYAARVDLEDVEGRHGADHRADDAVLLGDHSPTCP
jgi:nicotinamidase-related amidase